MFMILFKILREYYLLFSVESLRITSTAMPVLTSSNRPSNKELRSNCEFNIAAVLLTY